MWIFRFCDVQINGEHTFNCWNKPRLPTCWGSGNAGDLSSILAIPCFHPYKYLSKISVATVFTSLLQLPTLGWSMQMNVCSSRKIPFSFPTFLGHATPSETDNLPRLWIQNGWRLHSGYAPFISHVKLDFMVPLELNSTAHRSVFAI